MHVLGPRDPFGMPGGPRHVLGEDGEPKADLFREDMLHLNDKGYALWNSLLVPHLQSPASAQP